MNRLFVTLDLPTAAEAAAAAKAMGAAGVGTRVGPRLLARVGPMVIAALRESGSVFVDVRVSGGSREVVAAVRAYSAYGASAISFDDRVAQSVIEGAVEAVGPYGTLLLASGVPPDAVDPPEGRGKAMSAIARRLADSSIAGVLGQTSDVGVVAQVAPRLGVVVFDAQSPGDVTEALRRGALASVVDDGIGRTRDPRAAVNAFVDAIRAADTIDRGGA